MSKRRLFVLIMAVCVVICMIALMTACGSRDKSGGETAAASEETTDDSAGESAQEQSADTAEQEESSEDSETAERPVEIEYVIAEDGLFLRKGPGTENDVEYLLTYGQEVQIEDTANGWVKTTVDGHTGWCSMEFLTGNKAEIKEKKEDSSKIDSGKLVEPENSADTGFHGYVDSPEGLNLRFGPGPEYDVITVVPDKTDLVERGWADGWVYVEYKGKFGWISAQYFRMEGGREKPVIYLYPTRTTDVTVNIRLADGRFTQAIPAGNGSGTWNVTAEPDGRLTDRASGKTYDYIFWESTDNTEYDWSEGFVVKGSEAESFLLGLLPKMGLTRKEYTEFIEYWLPRLQKNEYNLVTFQTDRYTDTAELEVSPKPDSVLRVFMVFKAIDGPLEIAAPEIKPFERKGFTVVEWGGAEK